MILDQEQQMFQNSVQAFLDTEVAPHYAQWEKDGMVPREFWNRMGEMGYLCPHVPEEYGGLGLDFSYNMIFGATICDNLFASIATGVTIHADIVATYIIKYGSEEQKQYYLPKFVSGEIVGALGMTEPSAGSDVQGIKTKAIQTQNEKQYCVSGSKIFITNGYHADVVLTACYTDMMAGVGGVSLLLIDTHLKGVDNGKLLKKVGQKCQDTCEIFFEQVFVESNRVLGTPGHGFFIMMNELPVERFAIGLCGVHVARASLKLTQEYVKERQAFGKPLTAKQHIQFELAEMDIQITAAEAFLDVCMDNLLKEELDTVTASKLKVFCTDLQCSVVDRCLQLHGGYGYMMEYPIARAWLDSRVQPIYGGTNEIMKVLIARELIK